MWGIIPAAGNGTRIQPLAFSKELLPVGSRQRGRGRAAARGQRVSGRAHAGGRRRQAVLRDLAQQGRHPALLRRPDRHRRRRLHRPAAARRPVRRPVPRGAAGRPDRERPDRAAGHDLVSRGRLRDPGRTTGSRSSCSRSSARSCSTPWRWTASGRRRADLGQVVATPARAGSGVRCGCPAASCTTCTGCGARASGGTSTWARWSTPGWRAAARPAASAPAPPTSTSAR